MKIEFWIAEKQFYHRLPEKLSVNEKLLYLYEFDLENEFEVDLDTGKVTEIK